MSSPQNNPADLSRDELIRYSRQMMLPEIGKSGQEKLKAAHILIVGCGGLGCPAAQYLNAAGIGHLTLLDDDQVALSNLQRQILFGPNNIGQNKAASAAETLQTQNPHSQIKPLCERADEDRLIELIQHADVVLDCSDNFSTRYQVNRAAYRCNTPLVSGAAIRWQGQLTVCSYQNQSPCYHCLFPETADHAENCATAGIVSPVTGIIGSFQALAAMRIILGLEPSGSGQLWLFDGLGLNWRQIQTQAEPNCPVCG